MVANSGKTFGDFGIPTREKTLEFNQFALGNIEALREAAEQGVTKADLPMPYDRRNKIVIGLIKDLEQKIPAQAEKMRRQHFDPAMIGVLSKNIQTDVTHKTDKSIDGASLAAASAIMPRLAKNNRKPPINPVLQDTEDITFNQNDLPKSVGPDILSGLGEGIGEDELPAAKKIATAGGGVFSPETSTQPKPEDFSALEPGRENFPAFDMSPRQKAAFAQQMLEQQLAQPSDEDKSEAGGDVTEAEAPEADEGFGGAPTQPTRGVDQLLQLQQNVADANKNFATAGKKSIVDHINSTKYSHYKYKKRHYQELLALDKEYRTAQRAHAGLQGEAQQNLARKVLYLMGLNALEKQADKVGDKLRYNIEHGKFTGFIIALCFALIVDGISIGAAFFDAGTVSGLIMSIVSIGLIIALYAVIFGHGHYFRKWVVERLFGKQIVRAMVSLFSLFLEVTPVGNVVPMWTIQILWMKYDVDKAIKEHEADLKRVNQQIKKELRRAKHGQVNLRKISKLQAKLNQIQKKAYA